MNQAKKRKVQQSVPEWLPVLVDFTLPDLVGIVMEYLFESPFIRGECVKERKQTPWLWSVMAHLDGFLYVINFDSPSVSKLDGDLNLIEMWGTRWDRFTSRHTNQNLANGLVALNLTGDVVTSCGDVPYSKKVAERGDEIINTKYGMARVFKSKFDYRNLRREGECKTNRLLLFGIFNMHKVLIIDVTTESILREIHVQYPHAITVHGNYVYIACPSCIQVFHLEDCNLLYEWPVDEPSDLIFFNNRLVVMNRGGDLMVFE